MYEPIFHCQSVIVYRVEYLCSARPVWYPHCDDAGNIAEFSSLSLACQVANQLCDERGGRPVRVVDDSENVKATAAWTTRIAYWALQP